MDAGNFEAIGEVLEQAQAVPGLEAAIAALHQRFDSNESWTAQLQTYREQMQQKVRDSR